MPAVSTKTTQYFPWHTGRIRTRWVSIETVTLEWRELRTVPENNKTMTVNVLLTFSVFRKQHQKPVGNVVQIDKRQLKVCVNSSLHTNIYQYM